MGDEDAQSAIVPWRTITLWIVATSVGGLATWLYTHSAALNAIKEQQVINTNIIDSHNSRISELHRRLDLIESTKIDNRFRSDDWEAQRKILDAEFKSVWKAIDECRRPPR